ncbi:YidC/Oxa1 family membrane protein insertase [Patescibacteria group bacterium]|nr:YidC/Oxa1 family membrane protein insertase [Patescibacteria group bacterium]MBU1885978.1 YidC/Oxa1 family membrane protein insertase [Patescibacteria group bacterium]
MQNLTNIFFEFLLFLYQTTGNLGIAIIILTLIIRFALVPLTLPSLKAREKITKLQPEIDKLKKKHGKDKQAMQKAQMELYKKYNVNPLSGCLPQLVQLGFLIFLYQALIGFLGQDAINGTAVNPAFLWLDLTSPDTKYVLPVLAGVSQFLLSLMISPGGEIRDIVPNKSKSKKVQKENEKEEDTAGMAASMQQQMIFIMPVMTVFIAAKFPSGLAVYWLVTTLFSIGQQYVISGWGGLKSYSLKAKAFIYKNR